MKRLIVPALIAGLAGGLAEMVWIAFYSSATSTSGMDIARQVTATVFLPASEAPLAPWAGMGIHIALSFALGLAFVVMLRGLFSTPPTAKRIWAAALLTLASIWAVNFFLILPVLNPSFVVLMPYGATLLSKMLFGAAMACVLQQTGFKNGPAPALRI